MKKKALIIGTKGTLGQALQAELGSEYDLLLLSRDETDYSEASLQEHAKLYKPSPLHLIINTIGVLHDDVVTPEKRLSQLEADKLAHYYYVNAILPALCIKYFTPLLERSGPTVYANLSAMVGSIGDNQLGGWYGYRSSKAALNMLIKTASIELKRVKPKACLVAIHPGTTQSSLSKPYSGGVAASRYYTPAQSAERIYQVLQGLEPEQTGQFLNWDGSQIPW